MKQIVPKVIDLGFKWFDWNVDSEDASTHVPSKDQIFSTVIKEFKMHNTNVILFLDAAQHQSSIDALPTIISTLKSMGYTFDTPSTNSPTIEFAAS